MATKQKIKFETMYNSNRIRKEYFRKIEGEHQTNQDQLAEAKLSVMAEKFGITALMSKAKQTEINEDLQAELYGNDLTTMITDRTNLLQTKENLRKTFTRIPAIIRKNEFGDKVENFVEAYTSGDLEKLKKLNKIGLIDNLQIEKLNKFNEDRKNEYEKAKMQEFEKYAKKMNYVKAVIGDNNEKIGNNEIQTGNMDNNNNSSM